MSKTVDSEKGRKKTSVVRTINLKKSADPGTHPVTPLAPVTSRSQREQTRDSLRKRTSVA